MANNLMEEWNRIRRAEQFFIQYKLEFPVYKTYTVTPPLPTVKNVIVNNRVLCSGGKPSKYADLTCADILPYVKHVGSSESKERFAIQKLRGLEFYFWQHPARLDTRTAGVTRQCSRKDGSFPYLHT